jgi:hypothetical protein
LSDIPAGGTALPARCRLRARATVSAACLLGIATLALSGCTPGEVHAAAGETYGSLPTFLPTSSVRSDSELTGTTARPALTTQGDSVRVMLADSWVHAMVSGPQVPGEGLPYRTRATTCTWTVTLIGATKTMPITIADFDALGHLGTVFHVALVAGQPVPPAVLAPGRTVTFELRAVMPTGEGLMRWAPGGKQIKASWDFIVEND